jgi:hypothetical protein
LPRLLIAQHVTRTANIVNGGDRSAWHFRHEYAPETDAKSGRRENIASTIETYAAFTILRGQMDARALADRQQVFLMYRELFTGRDVRKRKTIRKIVLNHLRESKVSTDDVQITNIVSILKSLLEDGVFQSAEQASKYFPDLVTRAFLERPTGNISKKRKASSGTSINVGRVVQTEAIDKVSQGNIAGMHFNHSSV